MSTSPRAVAALLVIGALFVGVVLGVVGDHAYLLHTHQLMLRRPPLTRMVDHLDHQLHFTPQQRDAVMQIVQRHRARMEGLMASVRPQMRQEIDATNAEIEKLLTPQQREKFRGLWMRRHGRGEPPAGMPPPPRD